MSEIQIAAGDVASYHGDKVPTKARLYANKQFTTNEGIIIEAGSPSKPDFYQEFDASLVNGDTIRIASGTVHTTTDSNKSDASYSLSIYTDDGELITTVFSRLIVPPDLDPTTWAILEMASAAARLPNAPTYLDTKSILGLFDSLVNAGLKANEAQIGSVRLDTDPDDLNEPIALGANSPVVEGLTTGVADLGTDIGNLKTINGQSIHGPGNIAVADAVESTVSTPSILDTLIAAADSDPSSTFTALVSDVVTVTGAKIVPENLRFRSVNDGKFVKGVGGTIEFAGIGLISPDSQSPVFSGFGVGDVTWTGPSYPGLITTSLWEDADLSAKMLRAAAAVDGLRVTIKTYPGNFGARWILREHQSLYLTKGTYTNTIDAPDEALFVLESNTCVYGDGMGLTIIEESSALTRNVRLFVADGMANGSVDGFNENIEIRDLQINGHANQAWFDNGPATILLGNCTNGHVRRVKIKDTHAYGVYIGGFRTSGHFAKECSITECYFEHVIAQNCGILNGRNCRIERNTFVLNPTSTDPLTIAIDVEPNAEDETVESVIVRGNKIDAREAEQSCNGIIVQYGGSENGITGGEISDNEIIGYDLDNASPAGFLLNGVTLAGGYGTKVYNNKIQGCSQSGMYLTNGRYLDVHDNTVRSCGANASIYAVRVESVADSNLFNNIVEKIFSLAGTDDSLTELATSQFTGTAAGSTITTSSWVLPHWKSLVVTFNGIDYTVNAVTDFSHFTTTVAVGTVGAASVASATDVDAGANTITSTAHPYNNDSLLRYTAGTAPIGGLTSGNDYYVVNKTANTFQLSLTLGGAAIDLTSTGTGTQTFTPILKSKFGNNLYSANKRGSVTLLNGSIESSHMAGSSGMGGSTGATDNAALVADGTGGSALKASPVIIDADGQINVPNLKFLTSLAKRLIGYNSGAPAVLINPDKVSTIRQYGNDIGFVDSGDNINVKIDNDATAGNTRLLIWDVDNNTLERVSVGAADSGGAGFKALRIPN
jgi:hypothetical protein